VAAITTTEPYGRTCPERLSWAGEPTWLWNQHTPVRNDPPFLNLERRVSLLP